MIHTIIPAFQQQVSTIRVSRKSISLASNPSHILQNPIPVSIPYQSRIDCPTPFIWPHLLLHIPPLHPLLPTSRPPLLLLIRRIPHERRDQEPYNHNVPYDAISAPNVMVPLTNKKAEVKTYGE